MPINTKGLVPRIWRVTKRIFIFLFCFQLFYLLLLKWVNFAFELREPHRHPTPVSASLGHPADHTP